MKLSFQNQPMTTPTSLFSLFISSLFVGGGIQSIERSIDRQMTTLRCGVDWHCARLEGATTGRGRLVGGCAKIYKIGVCVSFRRQQRRGKHVCVYVCRGGLVWSVDS